MSERLYITNISPLLDEDMFSRALALVSQQRRMKALRYKNRADAALSLCAELLLLNALVHDFGYKKLPVIAKGEHGKPYFTKPQGIHFSLSHSGEYAVCLVSNEHEVGVDIERVRNCDMRTARRVLSKHECEMLENTPEPERDALFTELWVRYESTVKLLGGSVLERSEGRGSLVAAPSGYRLAVAAAELI